MLTFKPMKNSRPAYPQLNEFNPMKRYEDKILQLIARIERQPFALEYTRLEAREIWKYYNLVEFFPLQSFAARFNAIAQPNLAIQRAFNRARTNTSKARQKPRISQRRKDFTAKNSRRD